MGDGWELEAIHEQFDVFEKLTTPYTTVAVNDYGSLIRAVQKIIKNEHVGLSNHKIKSLRDVCCEIIKNVNKHQRYVPHGEFKLSFIVLVTNQEENDRLCKIPVFIILFDKMSVYIDMNTTVYNTWEDFKRKMDLPACTFCSPKGGSYKVGQQLQVEFSKSPAAYFYRNLFIGGAVVAVGVGAIALSLFCKIPQTVLKIADDVVSVVTNFLPSIQNVCLDSFMLLVKDAQAYRNGKITLFEFSFKAYRLLIKLHSNFSEDISAMWLVFKEKLQNAYSYICNLLYKYFKKAPESSQHLFLAITHRVDSEIIALETDVDEQMRAACENNTPYETNATEGESEDGTNQHIFENCKSDVILNNEITGKKNEMGQGLENFGYRQKTVDIMNIAVNVASELKKEKLTDVRYIFESIHNIITVEYKREMVNYNKGVIAATNAAGHTIDLTKYNKSLGISGDPKDHYWLEALKILQEVLISVKINEEILHLRNKEKICIIPVLNKTDDGSAMYHFNGVQGAGKISARSLLNTLKDEKYLTENNLEIKSIFENSSIMSVRSEECIMTITQEIDEENTSTGSIILVRVT